MKKAFGLGLDDYVRVELARSILNRKSQSFWAKYRLFLSYLDEPQRNKVLVTLNKIKRKDTRFLLISDQALVLLIGLCLGSVECWFGIHGLKKFHYKELSEYLNIIYLEPKTYGKTLPLRLIPPCFFYDEKTDIKASVMCFHSFLKDKIKDISIPIESLAVLSK